MRTRKELTCYQNGEGMGKQEGASAAGSLFAPASRLSSSSNGRSRRAGWRAVKLWRVRKGEQSAAERTML